MDFQKIDILSLLPQRQHFPGFRIDDFGIEMVFGDV